MTGRGLWLSAAAVVLFASVAVAQTVYRWRDANGVVHFSDEKPEGVKEVDSLTLEAPAPIVSGSEGGKEGGAPASMAVTPAPGQAAAPPGAQAPPPGPSEVVFLGADLAPTGATTRRVRGKLRNAGGEPARRVAVRVVISDGDTGNLCTAGEIAADPSSLGPGENGTFEGTLDTPCFYGTPKINYYPEWD